MSRHAPRRSNLPLTAAGLGLLLVACGHVAADSPGLPAGASNGSHAKSMPPPSTPNGSRLPTSTVPLQASTVSKRSWLNRAYEAHLGRGAGIPASDVTVSTLESWTGPVRMTLGGAWVGSTDRREHEFLVQRQEYRASQKPPVGRK